MWNLSDDGVTEWSWQVGHYLDLRAQSRSFEDLAAYNAYGTADDFTLSGSGGSGGSGGGGSSAGGGVSGGATRLSSVRVTQNFFAFLGVQPAIGRTFTAEESLWNGPRAVMLSDALWRSRFASDPAIAGRTVTLNEQTYTVVGVLPASFDFSTVFAPGVRRDIYLPMPPDRRDQRLGQLARRDRQAAAGSHARCRARREPEHRAAAGARSSQSEYVPPQNEHVGGPRVADASGPR